MDIGLRPSDDCINEYKELKMSQKYRYIIYKIEGENKIVIESTGERTKTYEDFVASLPKDEPRYAIFDFSHTMANDRKVEKLVFVHWCPDDSKVKKRMISTSSN